MKKKKGNNTLTNESKYKKILLSYRHVESFRRYSIVSIFIPEFLFENNEKNFFAKKKISGQHNYSTLLCMAYAKISKKLNNIIFLEKMRFFLAKRFLEIFRQANFSAEHDFNAKNNLTFKLNKENLYFYRDFQEKSLQLRTFIKNLRLHTQRRFPN